MSSRWTGFFIWALVAASAAFWGLRIFAATRPVPVGAIAPQAAVAVNGPMERLFGAIVVQAAAQPVQHPESERFQLVGVIAPRDGAAPKDGLAIVTVDGAPAKAWHVGATLDGRTTLLGVSKRSAQFGPSGGPANFTLELPSPSAAATGTLAAASLQPPAGDQFGAPPMLQASPQQETAQHVGQPPVPGAMRGMSQGFGQRGVGAQSPPADVQQPGRLGQGTSDGQQQKLQTD